MLEGQTHMMHGHWWQDHVVGGTVPKPLRTFLRPRGGPYSLFWGSGSLKSPFKAKKGTLFIPRLLLGLALHPASISIS